MPDPAADRRLLRETAYLQHYLEQLIDQANFLIIATDLGPPSEATAARVSRAVQLWDAHRALSNALREKPWAEADGESVWDYVAVFPPGARWGDAPSFHGAPVVRVAESLRAALPRP